MSFDDVSSTAGSVLVDLSTVNSQLIALRSSVRHYTDYQQHFTMQVQPVSRRR